MRDWPIRPTDTAVWSRIATRHRGRPSVQRACEHLGVLTDGGLLGQQADAKGASVSVLGRLAFACGFDEGQFLANIGDKTTIATHVILVQLGEFAAAIEEYAFGEFIGTQV